MITILVIADDFTGALDSGVQLTKAGIKTLVTTDSNVDFSANDEYQALVVDTESRHISPKDAGTGVFNLAKRAAAEKIPFVYKKTDSTLRGNVGSELDALLRALDCGRIYFAPAFPKTGRTTENGIQYLNGVSLEKTAFAHDPIDPVKTGVISEIIASQAPKLPVSVINADKYTEILQPDKPDILIMDAKCDNDLSGIAGFLNNIGGLHAAAGCAGLLEYYPRYLGLNSCGIGQVSYRQGKTLLVSGSVNQVSVDQLSCAKSQGYKSITLTPEQKLNSAYPDSRECSAFIEETAKTLSRQGKLIIESISCRSQLDDESDALKKFNIPANQVSAQVAYNMGKIVAELISVTDITTLIVFGGDTLHSIMQSIGTCELIPVSELLPGIVMARFRDSGHDIQIITKAGGFGETDLIFRIDDIISGRETTKE